MSHSVYTALEDERVKSKGESGQMVRKLLLVFALTVVLLSFAGCQTIQGIGRDIEWVGEKGSEIVQ